MLVTGGSRGLGLAIARRFAATRVRLVLASRKMEELEQAQAALLAEYPHLQPEDFYLVAADLAKPEECKRLVAEAIGRYGRIDVLVNNAGIIEVGPIEAQPVEAFERAMQVNFMAAMYVTWAALPHMRSQPPLVGSRRAAIVNIVHWRQDCRPAHAAVFCCKVRAGRIFRRPSRRNTQQRNSRNHRLSRADAHRRRRPRAVRRRCGR